MKKIINKMAELRKNMGDGHKVLFEYNQNTNITSIIIEKFYDFLGFQEIKRGELYGYNEQKIITKLDELIKER